MKNLRYRLLVLQGLRAIASALLVSKMTRTEAILKTAQKNVSKFLDNSIALEVEMEKELKDAVQSKD